MSSLDHSTSHLERKLKLAFVGGAEDSAVGMAHRVAVEMDKRFELVAGAFSRSPQKSRSSAVKYGLDPARAYAEMTDLLSLESKNIDAVVILTPQDQHAAHVLQALEARVPVICEKALATSVSEGQAILDQLHKTSGFLAVTYNYTGYPMVRELKRLISDGRLGEVQQIHMEMPQEGFAKLNAAGEPIVPQSWRLKDGEIPTLSLDLAVHLHMLARFLTGQSPIEVAATSNSLGHFKHIVDNVSCMVRYSGGVEGNMWYGKTALGYRNGMRIRVFGTKGAAEWIQENPECLAMADNRGNRMNVDRGSPDMTVTTQSRYQRFKGGHPAGFIEAFANYYFDIGDALHAYLNGGSSSSTQYTFGIDESLEGLRLLDAIARSSKSHQWEKVS